MVRPGQARQVVHRVVVVDDSAPARALVRRLLRRSGRFEVVGEAADGAEGIQVVVSTQPDVVLLDASMPGLGGLATIPKLKEVAPTTAVVIFSAARDSTAREAMEAGALGFITKGPRVTTLARDLAALLDGRSPR